MITTPNLNWLAAILIAMLLASAHLLDGPSDIDAAQDIAADVADAIHTAQADQQAKGTHILRTPAGTQITGAQ